MMIITIMILMLMIIMVAKQVLYLSLYLWNHDAD